MALTNWWMLIPIALAIGVGAFLFIARDRPVDESSGLLAANTQRMRSTHRFAQLAARYRLWTLVQLASVIAIVLGATLLSARLTTASGGDSEQHNRDIMLCLDVSGSMSDVDAGLMRSFAEISDELRGERIGLTVWNASAVVKFPLTNDYVFIADQLEKGAVALEEYDFNWDRGVNEGDGSSLIGDGLASCVQGFDRLDEQRARTILLATDNQVSGDAIYTLEQAVQIAVDKEIVVHGIAPYQTDKIREMRELLTTTGGNTYLMDDQTGADQIVASIETMDRQRLRGMPVAAANDFRLPGVLLAGLGLTGFLVAGWRLRR